MTPYLWSTKYPIFDTPRKIISQNKYLCISYDPNHNTSLTIWKAKLWMQISQCQGRWLTLVTQEYESPTTRKPITSSRHMSHRVPKSNVPAQRSIINTWLQKLVVQHSQPKARDGRFCTPIPYVIIKTLHLILFTYLSRSNAPDAKSRFVIYEMFVCSVVVN